ncbi:MAG: hypothetical protein ABSF28_00380 [Terracidiphilus sp.]
MGRETVDEFERELRQALERRPAPPGLKRKVMAERSRLRTERLRSRTVIWQRLAASLALAAVVGGGWVWREREQERKGEEARRQVMIALRITGHALNQMKIQLAAHHRADGE